MLSLVKFTLDLLVWKAHLRWHWPITPNSALQVLSPLELDSNFGFWPLEQERVFDLAEDETCWEPVWTDPPAFISYHWRTGTSLILAFILSHQIWDWPHWRCVFKGPLWLLLPQDHGLSLGQHYAAVWGASAQDWGHRCPTDQEQRPPAKTLL